MQQLLRRLDNALNAITMYRLVLYGLALLIGLGVVLCGFGLVSFSARGLLLTTLILTLVCYSANRLLARIYHAPANTESSLITALILSCILPQTTNIGQASLVALAGIIAIAAKYVLAWRHAHVFNPAASGVAIMAGAGFLYATWWIGSPIMLPFTLILGLLVVRKIRRFSLLGSFMLAYVASMLVITVTQDQAIASTLQLSLTASPLIFFATIMLTEPSTTPPTRRTQIFYAMVVGVLYGAQLQLGSIYITPELALLIGNGIGFIAWPRQKIQLRLQAKNHLSANVVDFVFKPQQPLNFKPGPYMEWTLPHTKTDYRGNRRNFSIASAPHESTIRLGTKFYKPSSSFKTALLALKPGTVLSAGRVAGDFTLPDEPSAKLVWLAGGIGVTPFRSMAAYLMHTGQQRDIIFINTVSNAGELSYKEIFTQAKSVGVQTRYVLSDPKPPATWPGLLGNLTPELLRREVPDFMERIFYISGPDGMVHAYSSLLQKLGVPRHNIRTDYFSGY